MKRSAAKLVVFLLLGAIVNIAVAWGCAIILPRDHFYRPVMRWSSNGYSIAKWNSGDIACYLYQGDAFGATSLTLVHESAALPEWESGKNHVPAWGGLRSEANFSDFPNVLGDHPVRKRTRRVFCAGLPFRTLWCELLHDLESGGLHTGLPTHGEWRVSTQESRYISIPLFPIWPGFAINTIFYAAVLWMMFAIGGLPFVVRRRRRIKRGLLPACAYPVGTSPVCTECGKTLPSPSRK